MLSVQFLRFEQSNCSSTVAIRMVADVEYGFRYDPMFLAHCTHTGQHNSNCLLVFPIPPAAHLITSLADFVHYYFISDFIHLFYAIITFVCFFHCMAYSPKKRACQSVETLSVFLREMIEFDKRYAGQLCYYTHFSLKFSHKNVVSFCHTVKIMEWDEKP